jgi:hypothetical protein
VLDVVETDTQGPFPLAARDGSTNNIKFVDAFSGYTKMETLPDRTAGTVAATFRRFMARMERRTGRKIKVVRADGGTEYMGEFLDDLEALGIVKQKGLPYQHQHPGRAERVHPSIMRRARAMLLDSKLPSTYYAEAQLTAAYLHNRMVHGSAIKTPFELVYGRRPDLSHLRPFGCIAYAHVAQERRSKLAPAAERCRLLGYGDDDDTEEIKGYKLLRERDYAIVYSSDVRFDEAALPLPLPGHPAYDAREEDLFGRDLDYAEEEGVVDSVDN